MAMMIQQKTAWQQLMEKHPTICLVLQSIGDLLAYFTNGQILVDLWRWAILTSGNVSEAALMFAALWITAASVEPDAINSIPYGIPGMLSAGSMFALTLLPEIVVYAAIATCYEHWRNAVIDKGHRGAHITWAALYSLPTLTFLVMTVYTLCSFVSIGHTFAAPPFILTARCLSGWSYGVVGLIHATITKKSPVKFDTISLPAPAENTTEDETVEEPIAQESDDVLTLTPQLTFENSVGDTVEVEETQEKVFPVIEDEEDEDNFITDDELSDQENTTEPLSIVTPEDGNNGAESNTNNITFLHSTVATKNATNVRVKVSRGARAKKAATIIRRNPNITPVDLAKKADISQTYARQLLAKQQSV